MTVRMVFWGITTVALVIGFPSASTSQSDPAHVIGKDGLTIEDKVEATAPKVNVVVGNKVARQIPAKLFPVELKGGTRYRLTLESKEIDSVLVGNRNAWSHSYR
jgi:hypothetical protein